MQIVMSSHVVHQHHIEKEEYFGDEVPFQIDYHSLNCTLPVFVLHTPVWDELKFLIFNELPSSVVPRMSEWDQTVEEVRLTVSIYPMTLGRVNRLDVKVVAKNGDTYLYSFNVALSNQEWNNFCQIFFELPPEKSGMTQNTTQGYRNYLALHRRQ